jgi:hypothetical protein
MMVAICSRPLPLSALANRPAGCCRQGRDLLTLPAGMTILAVERYRVNA